MGDVRLSSSPSPQSREALQAAPLSPLGGHTHTSPQTPSPLPTKPATTKTDATHAAIRHLTDAHTHQNQHPNEDSFLIALTIENALNTLHTLSTSPHLGRALQRLSTLEETTNSLPAALHVLTQLDNKTSLNRKRTQRKTRNSTQTEKNT